MSTTKNQRGDISTTGDDIVLKAGATEQVKISTGANAGSVTHTLPSATSTLAGTNIAQTYTANQTIGQSKLLLQSATANALIITANESLTANRTLAIVLGDAARSITLGGDTVTGGDLTTSGATVIGSSTHTVTLQTTGATDITLPTSGTLVTTGELRIDDTDASNFLNIVWNENDTVDRTLNLKVNAANRTINLTGDLTLGADLTTTTGAVTVVGDALGSQIGLASGTQNVGGNTNGSDILTRTGTQTVTNKSIDSDNNTITNITNADIKAAAAIDAAKIADGSVSSAEFQRLDGVTSGIQSQIDTKGPTVTGAATSIVSADLTVSRALSSDASGKVDVSATTATELGHVSGVTSAIQTQINTKAPSTGPTFTDATFDDELTLQHITTPANPSAGYNKVYPKSDGKLYKLDSAGIEQEIGSGAGGGGGIDLGINPNAATALDNSGTNDVGDWLTTGTGVALARITSGLPLGDIRDSAIQLTLTSGTGRAYYRFKVPPASRNRRIAITVQMSATSYVAGTCLIDVLNWSDAYSAGEATVPLDTDDSSNETHLPNVNGSFRVVFDTDDREYYEVRLTNDGATAGVLAFNDFKVDPSLNVVSGPASGPVTGFTPTLTNNGSKSFTNSFTAHRHDNYLVCQFVLKGDSVAAGSSSDNITLTLPSGYTMDSDVLASSTITENTVGRGDTFGLDAVSAYEPNTVIAASTTTLKFYNVPGSSAILRQADINVAREVFIRGEFRIPIAEWAGSGNYYNGSNDVEYVYNSSTTVTTDSASFASGTVGGSFPAATVAGQITKRVQFSSPILASESLVFEVDPDGNGQFYQANGAFVANSGSASVESFTTSAGAGFLQKVSATQVDVYFSQYRAGTSNWNANSGVAKWRVVKSRAGSVSGFGLATAEQSGLVKAEKTYFDSSASGGTVGVTISNTSGVSFKRGVFVPTQTVDGTWWLKGSVSFTHTSDTSTTATITGVIFKNIAGYNQSVSVAGSSDDGNKGFVSPNTGQMDARYGVASTTTNLSFDVELDSKPTWAD